MNTFQELTGLGFTPTTITHDVMGLATQTRVYIRQGTPAGRTFLFIAGYLQPATSWSGLISAVWNSTRHNDDTLIVMARRGENVAKPSRLTGLLPLRWQQAEVRSATSSLENTGVLKPGTTVVGHSLGALLARHLVEIFPHLFARIVQIAPTPDLRWSLLFTGSFWKNGGFSALPSALVGMAMPWRGVRLARARLREMFAGMRISPEALETYSNHCVPDSAVLFTQLLFTYRGYELIRARRKGWLGRASYVGCPADAITSVETIENLVAEHAKIGIPTDCNTLAYETPHAWFANEFFEQANADFWRELFA